MSLNCNITIPDCGYIVSDTTNGTINIGKDEQIININGILNFDRSSVSTLTVLGNSYLVGDVTAYSKLNVIGKTTLKDALVVSGPICGLGGIAAISSFSVIGKSTFNGDVTITGKLDASGISYSNIDLNSLNVTGTTTLNLLDVSGNSTFNGTIDVSGNSTFNDVTINGNLNANTINLLSLDVTGNSIFNDVTINGTIDLLSLDVSGNSTFNDVTINGNLNANTISIDNLNLLSLDVSGNSTFNDVTINGNLNANTISIDNLNLLSLDVSGNSTFNDVTINGTIDLLSLDVSGNSTFNDVTINGNLNANTISIDNLNLLSLDVTGNSTFNDVTINGNLNANTINLLSLDVSGNSTFNDVTINGNLNANTINLLSLDVSGNSTFNDVTINGDLQVSSLKFSDLTLDNLNVTGQTTLNLLDVTGISNFTNINVTGLTTLGLTSIGNIPDVETAINMKADISALSSYLTKVEAANTYATITSVTPININGFDLVNYKFLQLNTSTTILGSQWINNVIGIPSTSTFTITLPSAFEIINTTLSGLAPIGSCFHTYLNYELGTGRNDIIIKTNNRYNSLTTIYEGFGYTTPVTDQLKLAVHRSYAPIFEPYTTHFISRIDSMTSMTIFKIQ